MNRVKIFNGQIITPLKIIQNGCIIVNGSKIECISDSDVDIENCDAIDAKGNYISPGFIDIHTHGGGGYDFMDGTVDAYLGAAKRHAQFGTTSMVPTTLTSSVSELKKAFEAYEQAKKVNKNGAQFLGLHLEGPYFSLEQKGAQDPRYLKNIDPKEYKQILSWCSDIVRWSAAPELEGADEFARYIAGKGVLPSIAHTSAIYEEVEKAFVNGFTHITHLYSGMTGVERKNGYRYAGVVESAFLIDNMTVEIIADGAHLPASLLKLIYKIKGPSKIALITDSMRAAGEPVVESIIGSLKDGQKVIVEDGVAKLPDRTGFAGSVATADRLVRTMVNMAGVTLKDAVTMMTSTPAEIMGIGARKGSIIVGGDADIVIFDKNINVKMTMVEGRILFKRDV